MIEYITQGLDIVLQIAITVIAARWAAERMTRWQMLAFACGMASNYSLFSDFSLSFLFSSYSRDLHEMATDALICVPIELAIAYFATRRRYVLALA
jgi:hypothetical protein